MPVSTKVRGFDTRIPPALKEEIKTYCKAHGITYTEFNECAYRLMLDSPKTGAAINLEYVEALKIAANLELSHLNSLTQHFGQRKKIAKAILMKGDEGLKDAFMSIGDQIKRALGLF